MVEAAPAASLKMPEPDLLLEFLIIALDTPAQLGGIDQIAERDAFRKCREPVFGWFILALGPLDQQPLLGRLLGMLVAGCNAHMHTCKPRGQPFVGAFPPPDRAPCFRAQPKSDLLDRDRIGRIAAPLLACPGWPRARRPHQGLRLNAGHIALSKLGDAPAQLGIVAIAGVQQRHSAGKADLTRPAHLLQCDLRFGFERDLLRHPRLAATDIVLGPGLRQVQPIGHRPAPIVIGKRQRYRRLAVRLLAELAAILVRHANRMPPLLGKARVVDDPRLDRAVTLDPWQHHLSHLAQHLRVGPTSLTDKMQQRLMLRRRSLGRRDRRHRLYALALARHDQPRAIIAQRTCSIRVPDHAHKPLDIAREPKFNVLRSVETHPKPPMLQWDSPPYLILKYRPL